MLRCNCRQGADVIVAEQGKVYRMIPDAEAAKHGYVRIVDESGGDYGYSAERFMAIDLPKSLERALFKAAS